FLVAVIWMDLMFDVLALGPRRQGPGGDELPEEALAQVAGYYRRVTTTASPMNLLISAVMAGLVGVLLLELVRGDGARSVTGASLALCAVPIVLALTRVFPSAIRLGSRTDDAAEQSRLARAICIDHLLCFAAMVAFVTLRLVSP
ncbi:MAG: hypothetical protein ABR587_15485, partial [Candidatus Binatia bacterium]